MDAPDAPDDVPPVECPVDAVDAVDDWWMAVFSAFSSAATCWSPAVTPFWAVATSLRAPVHVVAVGAGVVGVVGAPPPPGCLDVGAEAAGVVDVSELAGGDVDPEVAQRVMA